jgi:hypothetical protein
MDDYEYYNAASYYPQRDHNDDSNGNWLGLIILFSAMSLTGAIGVFLVWLLS